MSLGFNNTYSGSESIPIVGLKIKLRRTVILIDGIKETLVCRWSAAWVPKI